MSRQALINKASPDQLNKLARSYGFPSAKALQTVIELGSHLQTGGKITDKWMDRIAEAYPRVPRDHLNDIASNVRSLPDLAKAVGVDPAVAKEYVSNYDTSLSTQAISAKLDSHKDTFRGTASIAPRPELKAPVTGSIRDILEKQFKEKNPNLDEVPTQVRRDVIATAAEKTADRLGARATLRRHGEIAPDSSRERSIDIALTYDTHALTDAGEAELATMEVEPAMAQDYEPMAQQ